jgi:hypothetical protein
MMDILTDLRTPNFDKRWDGTPLLIRPMGILIHTGGGTEATDLHELLGKSGRQVSSNVYINRQGTIRELAPDNFRCWHAGPQDYTTRRWWGNNAASYGIIDGNTLIGLETEHRRGQGWPTPQIDAIEWWCKQKIAQYQFPYTRIGAHKWWRPTGSNPKVDPTDWPDDELQAWIKSLYRTKGRTMRVTHPLGARVRQGPGTQFPIAAALAEGTTFFSDTTIAGENIAGNDKWCHFWGPTKYSASPIGFVWSGIVEEVK